MSLEDLSGLGTLAVLIAFLAICYWAYHPKRKSRFDDDANLPFADEETHQQSQDKNN